MFNIGDRIRHTQTRGEIYIPATVVEVFDDGSFRYKTDHPFCIHPFIGWYQEGTCFPSGIDGWELLPTSDQE
jgi:hypothetical protein